MSSIEAIILAGGMGTRLKSVISDIPKPMAPINTVPFLEFLLKSLKRQSIEKVVLSTGYKSEIIEDYFGQGDEGLSINYCKEDDPLGTGGAIKAAISLTESDLVLILNGDTFFNIDVESLVAFHYKQEADISIAMRYVENEDRYGAMHVNLNGRVTKFAEKDHIDSGYINGGVYIMNRDIFEGFELPEKFSLENDFFAKHVEILNIYGKTYDKYFIDIGIPEDYEKACKELPGLV